jgi:hypothetical protein
MTILKSIVINMVMVEKCYLIKVTICICLFIFLHLKNLVFYLNFFVFINFIEIKKIPIQLIFFNLPFSFTWHICGSILGRWLRSGLGQFCKVEQFRVQAGHQDLDPLKDCKPIKELLKWSVPDSIGL